jgi:uncharacterized protein (TIGR00661 family)
LLVLAEGKKINKDNKAPRVLVAPLEWGLGHATRCIPIIRELTAQGCEVVIAAEGATKELLTEEFPQLEFIELIPYRVRYGTSRKTLAVKLASQIPKILSVVFRENRWLKKAVDQHKLDAIISDNRFGLYHAQIPCVYITHQLQIKTGNRAMNSMVRRIHYWFISKYTHCWVPDYAKPPGIAGDLSHPKFRPKNVTYIGCLSRFEKQKDVDMKYDLLFSMSGPEPQRTMFETLMIEQAKNFNGKVLLLRGLPGKNVPPIEAPPHVEVKNHLKGEALSEAIQSSEWMISRSGYTTIMDILKIQRKTILIPTPGQTEQEYLAKSLSAQRIFFTAQQEDFSLEQTMKFANSFPLVAPYYDMHQYKKVVADFVQALRQS